MQTSRISHIITFLVGAVFLVSAFAKGIDAAAFANLMSKYGHFRLGIGAPVIIITEALLALCLILRLWPKRTALVAFGFVAALTAIYAYGLTMLNIHDCGCFGRFSWLNQTPWLTFARNGVLMASLGYLALRPITAKRLNLRTLTFMACVMATLTYACGYSIHGAKAIRKTSSKSKPFQPYAVKEAKFADLLTLSPDSSYLIFAFSYTCPHCKNSIGNVEQYERMGYVDRTIALASGTKEEEQKFRDNFHPTFELRSIPQEKLTSIVDEVPTAFIVRNDTVVHVFRGEAFSPVLLRENGY